MKAAPADFHTAHGALEMVEDDEGLRVAELDLGLVLLAVVVQGNAQVGLIDGVAGHACDLATPVVSTEVLDVDVIQGAPMAIVNIEAWPRSGDERLDDETIDLEPHAEQRFDEQAVEPTR